MPPRRAVAVLAVAAGSLIAAGSLVSAQIAPGFRFDQRMSREDFARAGLIKLSADEIAFLERWIETTRPLDGSSGRRPWQDLPDVIESRIAGTFSGWSADAIFTLANGQVWQQSSYADESHYLHGPDVRIYRTPAGYRMKVEGVDQTVLVQRVR